ncbi:MAG: copper homeostasis protein CutC [Planctomycetota bacterium]|jgi:copper homeostasis protein
MTMLEVCVESLEGVRIATDAGADRIELSERLDVGGVTPSIHLLRGALGSVPLIALIRCRPGDFYFDESHQRQMLDEIQIAVDAGCAGVAVGASHPGDALNWDFLEAVATRYRDIELVVHRVFDLVPDPMSAIPRLTELGYRRILTSGGADHAVDSLAALREWQQSFGDRMEFLPAGGISSSNARQILEATGCRQLHGSFRGSARADGIRIPDPEEIRKVRRMFTDSSATP